MGNIITGILLGWVPDWVWFLLNCWPYIMWSIVGIVSIGLFYKVYRFGGWPALAAALGVSGIGLGFFLGSKKRTTPEAEHKKARRPSTTVHPKGETAWDRWERTNG